MYTGFLLSDKSRKELMNLFPPQYPNVLGHHITVKFGVKKSEALPEQPNVVTVVGTINDDNNSIQGLLVEVDGEIERPDGRKYHITWSIDESKGAKAFHTNNWTDSASMLEKGINVEVIPKLFYKSTKEYLKGDY